MKILFLTYQIAGQGGSYVRSFSLARQLVLRGQEVTLIASRSRPGLAMCSVTIDGVVQIEMPDLLPRRMRHGGLSPLDILFRSFWVFLKRFDVIHAFEHRPAVMLPALIGQRAKGAILVSDWADLWGHEGIAAERSSNLERILGQADDFYETRVRLWVDGVTAISSDLDYRLDQMGIPKRQHMILPPGANLDLIQPVDKQEARTKFDLPLEATIVAFSGYAPYDEAFLSQSVLDILRQDTDVMVISSGTVVGNLAKTAEQEGLADRLIQYGPLPLIENGLLLGAADVLLLPYLDKPINRGRFPNKFGDFLAAGRPIVSHPTGDLGELIAREDLGILSSELPEQFAEDALQLLHSPDKAQRIGAHARSFAEQHWSWALRAQQLIDFYARLRS